MKRIGEHTWETTEPTPIQIGRPASRPSGDALEAMRRAVSSTGATTVYWFWVSIGGDRPHLGLAVARPLTNSFLAWGRDRATLEAVFAR